LIGHISQSFNLFVQFYPIHSFVGIHLCTHALVAVVVIAIVAMQSSIYIISFAPNVVLEIIAVFLSL